MRGAGPRAFHSSGRRWTCVRRRRSLAQWSSRPLGAGDSGPEDHTTYLAELDAGC
jgi:hypothetical protein